LTVLCKEKEAISQDLVSIKHLDWTECAHFIWYRLWHPLRALQRPRASWAQMLLGLGIKDTHRMALRLVDADTVPSNLDTPTQRVKFFGLGIIAFVLGFRSVEIDVPNRTFRALSPLGTITTEEVPALGKVLRFEGDLLAFHLLVCRCHPDWIYRAHFMANGKLSFGIYVANGLSVTLRTIRSAVINNWPRKRYDMEETDFLRVWGRDYRAGAVFREATCLRNFLSEALVTRTLRTPQAALVAVSLADIRLLDSLTKSLQSIPRNKSWKWLSHSYDSENVRFQQFALEDTDAELSVSSRHPVNPFKIPHCAPSSEFIQPPRPANT
jgi:hypothetical protein